MEMFVVVEVFETNPTRKRGKFAAQRDLSLAGTSG
jgi:hypothetical protein